MDPIPSKPRAQDRGLSPLLSGVLRRDVDRLLSRLTDAVVETAAEARRLSRAAAAGGLPATQALAEIRLAVRLAYASARLVSAHMDVVRGRFHQVRYEHYDATGRLTRLVTRRMALAIPKPRGIQAGSKATPPPPLHFEGSNALPPPPLRGRGTGEGGHLRQGSGVPSECRLPRRSEAQAGGGGTAVVKNLLSSTNSPPQSRATAVARATSPCLCQGFGRRVSAHAATGALAQVAALAGEEAAMSRYFTE